MKTKQIKNSVNPIKKAQSKWFVNRTRDAERDEYAETFEGNLFLNQLNKETEKEFRKADGAELNDTKSHPAKMRAIFSSSALAVNFFDAWRDLDKLDLSKALGLSVEISTLQFEYKTSQYPVKPRSPNLDLLLTLEDGEHVAIESKFTESYRGSSHGLSEKYFQPPPSKPYWTAGGLPAAQKLAEDLHTQWKYLDVPQILKHMLGLVCDPKKPSSLLYLWYDTGFADANAHREEIECFAKRVQGDYISFVSLTYQEAFKKLSVQSKPVVGWYTYMKERYFSTVRTD